MVKADKRVAVFPGSFDPFTYGHREVVQQGLSLCDEVFVAVGRSGHKGSLFSAAERVDMIKRIFVNEPRVQVEAFEGLVVKFALEKNAMALIRGLRTEADFSYEMPMAMTNRKLFGGIQTIFFPTTADHHYVSSSLVKEVAIHGGDITDFVPQLVVDMIEEKMAK